MNLPTFSIPLTPEQAICIGCFLIKSKGECYTGKLNKGVNFAEKVTEELTWDPVKQETVVDLITKKIPIGKWARGWICRKCASDYRTVTHTRKNGEVWYEPVVILDRTLTQSQTIQGANERIVPSSIQNAPDDCFGFAPLPTKEEIDVKSFNALLGRRGRSQEGVTDSPPPVKPTRYKSASQLNAEAAMKRNWP